MSSMVSRSRSLSFFVNNIFLIAGALLLKNFVSSVPFSLSVHICLGTLVSGANSCCYYGGKVLLNLLGMWMSESVLSRVDHMLITGCTIAPKSLN